MRPLLLIALVVPLLGCPRRAEPPAQSAAPTVPPIVERLGPNSRCTSDAQCDEGLVCEGCSEEDKQCLPGCRTDADCSAPEHCKKVQCIRCPCPPLCGQ